MVLYLKYRPQSLNQLIGQDNVKNTLLSAFNSGKLSHAYLFVGPRGTGKTSTARILAKMVNCESSIVIPAQVIDSEANRLIAQTRRAGIQKEGLSDGSRIKSGMTNKIPCNSCPTCLSITDGSNLDLIEVDAASNRGIDDIRSLREKIKLAPGGGKKKVYIIDEVHMLTTEAFNALLKTLEEPPAHALFILATTEVHKVPQTILSRVQRLDFKFASSIELGEALTNIAESENLKIENNALQLIIKHADGSFRDGVKLLDQISSISQEINVDLVISELKSSKFEEVTKLLEYLGQKDVKNSILQIQKMLESGANVKELILYLMDIMRSVVYIKSGLGSNLVKPEMDEEKYTELSKLAEIFELKDMVNGLDHMQSALEKLKTASIQSLPLELTVVEMCDLKLESPVSTVQSPNPTSNFKHPTSNDDVTTPGIALLQEKWTFILDSIKPYNFSLEALLRHVKIVEVAKGSVVLEVPYSFHQRILEAPKSRDLLESVLSDVLSDQVRISCVIGSRPTSVEELANVEVAADDEIVKIAAEIFNSES